MPVLVQNYLLDPLLACGIFALSLAVAGLFSFLCGRMGGVFAEAVQPSGNKLASLEGLRGILALSVAAHHAYCWFFYTQTGHWGTQSSVIFSRFASFGVNQFFFISGFLFWRKLMKKGGIELGRFYLSRFVRLAPLYYTCIGIALFIGMNLAGFKLLVPSSQFVRSLVPWIFFSIGGQPDVNHAEIKRIIGVVWTLAMEWLFYLSLPYLGWFARKAQRLIHFACLFLLVYVVGRYFSHKIHQETIASTLTILSQFAKFMVFSFGGGILIAVFQEKIREKLRFSVSQANWLLVLFYAFYLFMPDFRGMAVAGQLCLLCGFALVIQGASLFGFITSKPVRFLGIISYDLYLVHSIIFYLAMKLRGGIRPVLTSNYILQTAVCFVVIVIASTVLHFLVERPSMKRSEAIARGVPGKRDSGIPEVLPEAVSQ
jgi:peptidoglycan/LPS O-acetylase OafA/YrhL